MATRVVEGKKPYTGGKAISIDENKVISLDLRDENNLIIYDEGDDEIYVDLQLDDEITPTDAFPIGVNTGRVIVDNGWDLPGTIISAVTTSGDNIKILYADDGTLWMDNGTGTFKQIYFKADVDALLLALRNYIDGELAKKQNGVSGDTAPSDPSDGDLWYDTTSSSMKVWDGTAWQSVGGGDVLVSDQANNIFTPGMKIWGGTQSDFNQLTEDSNTAYLILANQSSPRLPSAYQEVEYIETTGTQWIDTGYTPQAGDTAEIKFNMLTLTGDEQRIFAIWQRNWGWRAGRNSSDWDTGNGFTYDTTGFNVDIVATGTCPQNASTHEYLFAQNEYGTVYHLNKGTQRLYYCQISHAGDLVRDFVPCYRKADLVVGLYDLANDVFYTNDGTGTFIKGNDVN